MTQVAKEIFEKYEIRKTKAQKESFRTYITSLAKEQGYEVKNEKAAKGACNVIIGDPERADVIYTAHYDTCAIMPLPNFITPRCIPLYILYQLFLTIIIYIIPFSLMLSSSYILELTESQLLSNIALLGGYALLILFTYLTMCGPANKHTANDNTSGVTLLLDIMCELPEELRDKVAFIFFDLEELGMVGSIGYKRMHPKIAKEKLLLNFDCVSDGDNILFVTQKDSHCTASVIAEAFAPSGRYGEKYSVEVTKSAFYPSDQINFKRGVGVAALKKAKCGVLYMDKIHTKNDTVYDEENIAFLKEGAIKLAAMLANIPTQQTE